MEYPIENWRLIPRFNGEVESCEYWEDEEGEDTENDWGCKNNDYYK